MDREGGRDGPLIYIAKIWFLSTLPQQGPDVVITAK